MKISLTHVSGNTWEIKNGLRVEIASDKLADMVANNRRNRVVARAFSAYKRKNLYRPEILDPWDRKLATLAASFRNRGAASERFYKRNGLRSDAVEKPYSRKMSEFGSRDAWFDALKTRLDAKHNRSTLGKWDKLFENVVTNHAKRMRSKLRRGRPCGNNDGTPSRDKGHQEIN